MAATELFVSAFRVPHWLLKLLAELQPPIATLVIGQCLLRGTASQCCGATTTAMEQFRNHCALPRHQNGTGMEWRQR